MKKTLTIALLYSTMLLPAFAQQDVKPNVKNDEKPVLAKVYNENINPLAQIEEAVTKAKAEGKHVVCQVGGNWCIWCLRFADFIIKDEDIAKVIADNFVYIHVNYPRKGAAQDLMTRLGNPGRFGYPALVVLNASGKVIHIQDSSFLEEGQGYDKKKTLRFLNAWTPLALTK